MGLATLYDNVRDAGGIGAFLESGLGGRSGVTGDRKVVTVEDPTLAGPGTVARPNVPGAAFVIPFAGRFESPRRGETVSKGFFGNAWPATVLLQNFSAAAVHSPFIIEARERRLFGGDVTTTFESDPLVLQPGEERRITVRVPLGGDAFSKFNPAMQPSVLAKLSWPVAAPLVPRVQDTIDFQMVS